MYIRSGVVHEIKVGPSSIEVMKFTKQNWIKGFIKGAIPQLPLSMLNSVIVVCKLSTDLFPEREFSVTSISVTVGLMNLVGSWFGAVPTWFCKTGIGIAGFRNILGTHFTTISCWDFRCVAFVCWY